MRKITHLLTTGIMVVTLLGYVALGAGAEPGKNEITVTGAQCDNGKEITFVLDAMGKGLKLPEEDGNLIAKSYTLVYHYQDPETGEPATRIIEYGGGEKVGQTDDLVTCRGRTTAEIAGFGETNIDYELTGFFTPRG